MMAPSLAMAEPTRAISNTVACGPGWLSWFMGFTGSPAAAQAVSHSVISAGSAMREVYMTRGKSICRLKPNASAPFTSASAPISTPSWPNTVLEDISVACASVWLP